MTTLNGAIATSTSAPISIVVTPATHGKQLGYEFAIDGELFVLDSFGTSDASTSAQTPQWQQVRDLTKWNVSRGQHGSTPATHLDASVLSDVLPEYTKTGVVRQGGVVAAGAALTATAAAHDGKTILLNHATASVVTLPAAIGAGTRIRCVVATVPTGSHVVKVANSTDVLQGGVNVIDTDTAGTTTGFATAAADDTVTLNHGTSGAVLKGETLEFEDIAAGIWSVRGQIANTGNGATPFSATV